jgi:hypothetical protein
MHARFPIALLALLLSPGCGTSAAPPERASVPLVVFHGASDASAVEFLDDHTIVVGDDEDNTLRIYERGGGTPAATVEVSSFLGVDPRHPEADIEGAARLGDRIYWITSHGRNRSGQVRESRGRFFATEIVRDGARSSVQPVGRPCATLGPAIAKALAAAGIDVSPSSPETDLNVEALAASADGKTLYLGFRSPTAERQGKRLAIVLPLRNAAQVVDGGVAPDLGAPLLWDLGGRTIRSLEHSPEHKAIFAVASPVGGAHGWALFRWTGNAGDSPVLVADDGPHGSDVQPEGLAPIPGGKRLLLVSDDGARSVPVARARDCRKNRARADGTCRNKDLADPSMKTFRGFEISP